MLSLAKIRDVAAALGYYAEEIELGREEYYSGKGTCSADGSAARQRPQALMAR